MNLSQRIQAKTDNGDTIIDFLIEVMKDELDDFKICHRLDAARLLTKYGRDEAFDFILDNPPEPPRPRTDSGSSDESEFDLALAKKIRESTDDGASVCRFLINVMDGELSAFKSHHRIAAARELLDRGFGKSAYASPAPPPVIPAKAGIHEETHRSAIQGAADATHSSNPDPEEQQRWDEINEIIDAAIEESDRIMAEQGLDDCEPYVRDLSAFNEAWENSQKWFEEWKNSLDPDEYQAIIKERAANFDAKLNTRIERRKQIAAEQERREREEAEREAQQAKARAEAKTKADSEPEEPPDPGPPPSREEHETWSPTPNIPTSYRLRSCGHPRCKLHDGPIYYPEDDRSSPHYFDGRAPPLYGSYGL